MTIYCPFCTICRRSALYSHTPLLHAILRLKSLLKPVRYPGGRIDIVAFQVIALMSLQMVGHPALHRCGTSHPLNRNYINLNISLNYNIDLFTLLGKPSPSLPSTLCRSWTLLKALTL